MKKDIIPEVEYILLPLYKSGMDDYGESKRLI
jgi:hypothetical protein